MSYQRHPGAGLHHPPANSPKHQMHLPQQGSRIYELLDALKHEVEGLNEEAKYSKHQRKELEAKLNAQMSEMAAFQQSIFDLDRIHTKMKQQYDEEIRRLRHELEQRGISIPQASDIQYRKQSISAEAPPPNLSSANRNHSSSSFGGMMSQPNTYHQQYQGKARSYSEKGMGDPKLQQNRMKGPESAGLTPKGLSHGGGPLSNGRHRDSISGISLKPVQQGSSHSGQIAEVRNPEFRQSPYNQRPVPVPSPSQHMPPVQQPAPGHREAPPARSLPAYSHNQPPPIDPKLPSNEITLDVHPRLKRENISVDLVHMFDHTSVVCCVEFSPDGKYLATGCNHLTQIFEVPSGRKVLALVDESLAAKQEDLYIRSVCFSPDGFFLATGAEDKIIRVWDIIRGRVKMQLIGHGQDIYSLDWTRDGRFIVSGSGDRTVKVWNAENGKLIHTLANDSDPFNEKAAPRDSGVTSISIRGTDGRAIATGSLDDVIRVWDLRTGHLLERLEGHEKSVYSVAFSPDGASIVTGSLDQSLRVWYLSAATQKLLASPVNPDVIPEIIVNRNCRHVFTGHNDYVLTVDYPGINSTLGRVDSKGNLINAPDLDIDWVISGGKDRNVIFWDAKEKNPVNGGAPLMTLSSHKNSVISIAIAPAGGLFATGSGDQKARIWRVSRQGPVMSLAQQQQDWEKRRASVISNGPYGANSPMIDNDPRSHQSPAQNPHIASTSRDLTKSPGNKPLSLPIVNPAAGAQRTQHGGGASPGKVNDSPISAQEETDEQMNDQSMDTS